MNSAIPLALVGVNGFGLYHLRALKALQGRVALVAAADPILKPQSPLAKELSTLGIRTYNDYHRLLQEEPDLRAISLVAPIPVHHEMATTAIRHGLHVYLEKPPVPLLGQLDDLIRCDIRQRVHVGFQLTYSGWLRTIQQWIRDGKLGAIRSIRVGACWPRRDAYYRRTGWAGRMAHGGEPVFDGPATNALCHLIQAIFSIVGTADAAGCQPVEIRGELYRARPIEGYDTACLRGVLAGGIEFAAALTHATQTLQPYQIQVMGTKGWAKVSDNGERLESPWETVTFSETIDHLLARSYETFLGHLADPSRHELISLAQTRNCLLATNGLLLSSQRIFSIPDSYARGYDDGKGDCGYDVAGLAEAVAETLATGRLFAEQSLPWAHPTVPVEVATLTGQRIADAFRRSLVPVADSSGALLGS